MLLQEIAPYKYHNEYQPYAAREEDLFLGYRDGCVLAWDRDGEIALPTVGEYLSGEAHYLQAAMSTGVSSYSTETGSAPLAQCDKPFRYLFSIDEQRFFTLDEGKEAEEFGPYTPKTMRYLRVTKPLHLAYAAAVGYQLHTWYKRTRFCGSCGRPLIHAESERMMRCPACGEMYFPQICPSVIVAVRDGERILLTKYAASHFPKSTHNPKATYALVAGYIEIGETPEQCVRREVMEEVGLRVKNITPFDNQPWPFSSSLLFGFFCDLEGDNRITLQEDELAVAEWVERSHMEDRSADISLTSNMMEAFRLGKA